MKKWFRNHYHKKQVQFEKTTTEIQPQPQRSATPTFPLETRSNHPKDTGRSITPSFNLDRRSSTPKNKGRSVTPSFPLGRKSSTPKDSVHLSRSSTPTFPIESYAIADFYAGMDTSGPQTPSHKLSEMVKSRTPNGSLTSYYLDSNDSSLSRSMNESSYSRSRNMSPVRHPFKSEPRFVTGNVDANIRGRNHGYYIKAAGLSENEGNKENLKLIYDRSRMATPLNSNSASKYTSNFASRSGSFRGKDGHRRYRPKKRPAPRPPTSRQNSLDNLSANGEVAMKVFRKKKKAPGPPMKKEWNQPESVYPIEPPIDYNKDEKKAESSDEETIVPKLDIQEVESKEKDNQPAFEIVNVIPPPPPLPPPVSSAPVSARSNSPEPPPLPPKMDYMEGDVDSAENTINEGNETAVTILSEENQSTVENESKEEKPSLHRMESVLRNDIQQAALERMKKHPVYEEEIVSNYKSSHQKFAEELQAAFHKREARINKSTLIVRHISSSKMYKANNVRPTTPRTPVDDLIDKAQEQAKLLEIAEHERQKVRQSARIQPHEWIPEQDLDDIFQGDVGHQHLTTRSSNYYEITSPEDVVDASSQVLYKKGRYAKPNRKSGNLEKLKKSIGKAFGSIKGMSKKSSAEKTDVNYSAKDGWQILYTEECDKPPPGAFKIKRMEKQAAYAYNPENGQLVTLPDFDRIIVTQDGRRIRETELNKNAKSAVNKSLPSYVRKERPSLEGLFESNVSLHSHKAEEERKQIELMEQQFAQVRVSFFISIISDYTKVTWKRLKY